MNDSESKQGISILLSSKTIHEIDKIAKTEHRNRSQQIEHILNAYVRAQEILSKNMENNND